MTMPPPPPPGAPPPPPAPGGTTMGFIPPVSMVDQGKPQPSSLIPLIVAVFVVLAGTALYVFRDSLGANIWYLVGYFFTPFAAAMALGLDTLLHIQGQRNPWYSRRRFAVVAVRVVVVIGFAVGVLHILELGRWLGEIAVQSGWF